MSKSKGNVIGPDELDRRATAPTRCGSTSSSSGLPTRTWSGPTKASTAWCASCAASTVSWARSRERAPRGDAPANELSRKAHETIARVTDDIGRRLVVQHGDRRGDGARERAVARGRRRSCRALRRGDGRVADPAVCAARRRGAVGAARPRAALGAAVAGRRRVAARARHVRARRAGERQGARPLRGRAGLPGGRSSSRARRRRRACRRTSTARQVRKTIVVPRKLVNFVVG